MNAATLRWLVPTMIYVVALGSVGVTSKLALRHLGWHDLILWSGIIYVFVVGGLLARGQTALKVVQGTSWALVSAVVAISSLIMLYVALGTGEASKVVPISAAYPAFTLVLSAVVLRERLTAARVIGVAMVIGGVIIVTTAG
jgi:bacterial/archaeal transporter family protein